MESKLLDSLSASHILDFFSIIQTLIFGVFFCLIYILGAKLLYTIDERIFKKRFYSHFLTPWIKIAAPVVVIFIFLLMVYASDLVMNIMIVALLSSLIFYFLFKMIVSLAHYVPLMIFMGLKEGAVLEFRGQIGQIKKIGLFYVELTEGGKNHIIPTWMLMKSDFYISQNLKAHQVSLNIELTREINNDQLSKIQRMLEAKSYLDKTSALDLRVDGKKIFFNFKVNRSNLTHYAKKDITKTIQQFNL